MLKLCEMFDPKFDESRIVLNMKEFLDLLPNVPSKGFIAFDEAGISVGHRTWLSPANMAISMVSQSFRYKMINVIFSIPSCYYLDKVPREMCHYEIMMQSRGLGSVYKIYKSAFEDRRFTKHLGAIYLSLPSKHLTYEYEELRKEHQDALYEYLQKQQDVLTRKQEEKMQKALAPQVNKEEMLRICKAVLPQVVDVTKDSDQGLINIVMLRDVVEEATGIKMAHNVPYKLRPHLLDYLHENDNEVLKRLRRKKGVGGSIGDDSSGE